MESIPKELLDEAAHALARVLSGSGIGYAMCGGYLAVTLGVEDRETQDIDCIVQSPFKKVVRAFTSSSENFTVPSGLASDVLRVTFRSNSGIDVKVELLQAGMFGPVRLTPSNTMSINGIVFLSPTEYVRTKVKAWTSRKYGRDVWDVLWVLRNFEDLDIDRINPEDGLDEMAEEHSDIRQVWFDIRDAVYDSTGSEGGEDS
ncbi:hypothetical protein SISSUDRAFT_1123654 [Sistotremastrum suecicum HHB10207 ss-3]|uniref:Nucleotidyl transferase n=1 Tax=Sistotremastrum suecicum HHB10207 ss-3 TaxID=1314776 RepID=A0A165X7V6_9AGAM|nr:hypothetical protein SISSUDRAFT_1123654 [Sistotremastrum suecicum HHB10207 ss-3]